MTDKRCDCCGMPTEYCNCGGIKSAAQEEVERTCDKCDRFPESCTCEKCEKCGEPHHECMCHSK